MYVASFAITHFYSSFIYIIICFKGSDNSFVAVEKEDKRVEQTGEQTSEEINSETAGKSKKTEHQEDLKNEEIEGKSDNTENQEEMEASTNEEELKEKQNDVESSEKAQGEDVEPVVKDADKDVNVSDEEVKKDVDKEVKGDDDDEVEEAVEEEPAALTNGDADDKDGDDASSEGDEITEDNEEDVPVHAISSISGGAGKHDESTDSKKPEKLELKSTPIPAPVNLSMLDSGNLTERLEKALGSVAPLLREIFVDFAPYLSKTLIGSHGQELLIGGMYMY